MLTKIKILTKSEALFQAVLIELPGLCDMFTCDVKEREFLCHSNTFSGEDFLDELGARRIITTNLSATKK